MLKKANLQTLIYYKYMNKNNFNILKKVILLKPIYLFLQIDFSLSNKFYIILIFYLYNATYFLITGYIN